MRNEQLRSAALKGFLWNSIDKLLTKGIVFIVGVVLARILSPSDFGLIGMLAIFIAISQIFIESGFSKALVQKTNRNQIDYSTVFYFNLVVSVAIYLILFFCAPLIADFYNTPELTLLLRVLSMNTVIGSFNIVQRAILLIQMDFKTPAKVNLVAVAISGFLGIGAAYLDFGVWALVVQTISATAATTILFFFTTKWMPSWTFSMSSLKSLFSFGSKLLITGTYATILNNVYTIAIGKFFLPKELGYYTRANQLSEFSAGTINEIIQSVTFPILSGLQDDRERLLSVYSRLLSMTAFIVFPIMSLLAVLSESVITVLLTDKWLPAASLMFWLCFARAFTPINSINMNILNAIGRSDLFLKVDLAKLPIVILAMIITIPLGPKAIVIGNLVTTFIAYFINAYYPNKIFGYGAINQIRECYKIIIATVLMSLIVKCIVVLTSNHDLRLFIGSISGVILYIIFSWLFKVSQLKECYLALKNKIGKR